MPAKEGAIIAPPGLSPLCLRGLWVRREHLTDFSEKKSPSRWRLIPRIQWLGTDLIEKSEETWSDGEVLQAITAAFTSEARPLMIGRFTWNEWASSWECQERTFVLP
jgi:Domain of unknown function (DUF1853)